MKVVIADDDKVVIRLLSAGLRRSGLEVIPAYDAMQAIMATMRHLPDVVLLDINMPGGTGKPLDIDDLVLRLNETAA